MKVISAQQAADLIKDGATLAVGGFCGFGSPEELLIAIGDRFEQTGSPKNLTLFKGVSIGDKEKRGCSRISREGLISKVICAHIGLEPPLQKLVEENKCLAYMLPLGTVTELLRAAASHRPGVITGCGLHTFADPRVEGSKANRLTVEKGEDIVTLLDIDGEECLFYRPVPIDVCVIRGSYADRHGNISLDREALQSDQFEAAAAAKNSGGIVIVQVEDILEEDMPLCHVKLHHFMVDYVVKARPENHQQGYDSPAYRPELTGEIRRDPKNNRRVQVQSMTLNDRKVCGRRAAMELEKGAVINLGIGMPDAVSAVADEEKLTGQFTLSIESGVLGGVPLTGLGLGASAYPEAIYKMADILNIYNGGGLDMAVLGMAEVDAQGNVNVSKFGGRVTGPGGFVDISQHTKKVIFVGTFTAGGLRTSYDTGALRILQEGRSVKFRKQVEQISFSGRRALETGKEVLVVTERAVFRLTRQGLELIEIAPGMDLQRDILAHMEFVPPVSTELKIMDERIFRQEPMGLRL